MRKFKMLEGDSNEYSLYQSVSEPQNFFAMEFGEIDKMTATKFEDTNSQLPDSALAKVFKVDKITDDG